jgi:site-specific recombinase XerC
VDKMEMNEKIFESNFDPHNYGKKANKLLNALRENWHPTLKTALPKANHKHLMKYSENMLTRIKRDELAISTFWKNLQSVWKFLFDIECEDVSKISAEEMAVWWQNMLERYENKKIKHSSLEKELKCARTFLKFILESDNPPAINKIKLPKKPKKGLSEIIPSQKDVKRFIDSVYVEGKQYTIRDQAILSLINDTGARISEALSIKNKHIKPEGNYLIVSFPESKTLPRTVISFLAKPYLENWAKVSPNKNKGPDAFFFCQKDGNSVSYASVKKSFHKALKKTQIPWKKGQAMHYFRHIFTTRAFEWPYAIKQYWLGWSNNSIEGVYSEINYKQCIKTYFNMIKEENNPFTKDEPIFWEQESLSEKVLNELVEKNPIELKMLIRKLVGEAMRG